MSEKEKDMAEMRTLMVECKGGKIRKIEIPKSWAVTYGPVVIGAGRQGGESPNVLRIYRDASKKHLQAVFRDVIAFHDESVGITERVVRTKKKTFKRNEKNGEQNYTAEVRQTTWRKPYDDEADDQDENDLTEEFLALPGTEVPS